MSVELDPVELGFRRPFTQEVSEVLRLRNPTSSPVAFKVKTTAPKQYCVRPNSGRIEAGEVVEVQVLLQAMKEDPPPDAKCRDKFLVQSVGVSPDNEFTNVAEVWSNIEHNAKGSIQEKKIRVHFLPPGQGGVPAAAAAVTPARQSAHGDEPPAYSSPVSAAATPATASKTEQDSGSKAATSSAAAAGAGGVLAGAAAAIPTSSDELKAQLAEAKAQISRLTQQVKDQGLRQRKADSSSQASKGTGSGALALQQEVPAGVQVPLVAALCLLSFLIAYLLF